MLAERAIYHDTVAQCTRCGLIMRPDEVADVDDDCLCEQCAEETRHDDTIDD